MQHPIRQFSDLYFDITAISSVRTGECIECGHKHLRCTREQNDYEIILIYVTSDCREASERATRSSNVWPLLWRWASWRGAERRRRWSPCPRYPRRTTSCPQPNLAIDEKNLEFFHREIMEVGNTGVCFSRTDFRWGCTKIR